VLSNNESHYPGGAGTSDAKDVKSGGSLVPARVDHKNQRNSGLQIAIALLEQRVKVNPEMSIVQIIPFYHTCL